MTWDEVEHELKQQAAEDLVAGDQVQPCLVAFAGEEPLLHAFVRSFAKGDYHQPLIELFALAGGLSADRLALVLSGRAWSLDDPIPPVTEGADLRQRVVCILFAAPSGSWQIVHPFALHDGEVRWRDPLVQQGATGWIADALQVVAGTDELAASLGEVATQLQRCLRLGHDVALAPPVHRRLRDAAVGRRSGRACRNR